MMCTYASHFSFRPGVDIHPSSASILSSSSCGSGGGLRAGIYILKLNDEPVLPVIFWPEDTTWNDNAVDSVCEKRAIFMR